MKKILALLIFTAFSICGCFAQDYNINLKDYRNGNKLMDKIFEINSEQKKSSGKTLISGTPLQNNLVIWLSATIPNASFDEKSMFYYIKESSTNSAIRAFEKDFVMSKMIKKELYPAFEYGNFVRLKTSAASAFSYAISLNNISIIVIGNLEYCVVETTVKIAKLTEDSILVTIKTETSPVVSKGKIKSRLAPNEVQVLWLKDVAITR